MTVIQPALTLVVFFFVTVSVTNVKVNVSILTVGKFPQTCRAHSFRLFLNRYTPTHSTYLLSQIYRRRGLSFNSPRQQTRDRRFGELSFAEMKHAVSWSATRVFPSHFHMLLCSFQLSRTLFSLFLTHFCFRKP